MGGEKMQLNQAMNYMKEFYNKGKEAINYASLKAYVSTDNKLNGVITALLVPQAVQQDTTQNQNTTFADSTDVAVDGSNGNGEEIISGLVMLLGFGLIAKGKIERENYNFIKESYSDSAKLRHESKGTGKMVSGGVLLAGGAGSLIYFLTQG